MAFRDLDVSPLGFGDSYWTLTPYAFSDNVAASFYVVDNGLSSIVMRVNISTIVKLAVSLRANIGYTEGDGSSARPYVMEA